MFGFTWRGPTVQWTAAIINKLANLIAGKA